MSFMGGGGGGKDKTLKNPPIDNRLVYHGNPQNMDPTRFKPSMGSLIGTPQFANFNGGTSPAPEKKNKNSLMTRGY